MWLTPAKPRTSHKSHFNILRKCTLLVINVLENTLHSQTSKGHHYTNNGWFGVRYGFFTDEEKLYRPRRSRVRSNFSLSVKNPYIGRLNHPLIAFFCQNPVENCTDFPAMRRRQRKKVTSWRLLVWLIGVQSFVSSCVQVPPHHSKPYIILKQMAWKYRNDNNSILIFGALSRVLPEPVT
jgi:hypothetical protein